MARRKKVPTLSGYKEIYNLPEKFIVHLRPRNTTIVENAEPESFDDMITELSMATTLRKSEVKALLKAFGDLILRESIINGAFRLPGIFEIRSRFSKPAATHSVELNAVVQNPPRMRLTIELSPSIIEAYNWARKYELFKTFDTNADNYMKNFIIEGNVSEEEFKARKARGEFKGVSPDNTIHLKK